VKTRRYACPLGFSVFWGFRDARCARPCVCFALHTQNYSPKRRNINARLAETAFSTVKSRPVCVFSPPTRTAAPPRPGRPGRPARRFNRKISRLLRPARLVVSAYPQALRRARGLLRRDSGGGAGAARLKIDDLRPNKAQTTRPAPVGPVGQHAVLTAKSRACCVRSRQGCIDMPPALKRARCDSDAISGQAAALCRQPDRPSPNGACRPVPSLAPLRGNTSQAAGVLPA